MLLCYAVKLFVSIFKVELDWQSGREIAERCAKAKIDDDNPGI